MTKNKNGATRIKDKKYSILSMHTVVWANCLVSDSCAQRDK